MKKLLIFLIAALLISSCTGGVNYRVKIKKGDTRVTTTQEYVLTEICTGETGFGAPIWEKVSIERKTDEPCD